MIPSTRSSKSACKDATSTSKAPTLHCLVPPIASNVLRSVVSGTSDLFAIYLAIDLIFEIVTTTPSCLFDVRRPSVGIGFQTCNQLPWDSCWLHPHVSNMSF